MSKETVKKVAPLSETATEILEVLKASETPLTLAQIKTVVSGANPAHLVALRSRGLVNSEQVEVEVVKTTKAKVLQYNSIVEATEGE
jgi:hypothetical protein